MAARKMASGTIASMGLEAYLDTFYPQFGGYAVFAHMHETGETDQKIADVYHRKQPAINEWRQRYKWEQKQIPE